MISLGRDLYIFAGYKYIFPDQEIVFTLLIFGMG